MTIDVSKLGELEPLTEEQGRRCIDVANEIRDRVPVHWTNRGHFGPAGWKWTHALCPSLSVICTVGYWDGLCWIHASIAWEKKMPGYDELVKLKSEFVGEDGKAIMVLPAAAEHVNIHKFALHLYSCLDEDPLPDFTMGSGSI